MTSRSETCLAPLSAFLRCGLPAAHPGDHLPELDVARRDLAVLLETLTISQERGTALHDEVVSLKRLLDDHMAAYRKAEDLDAVQGEVAKALNLSPEQAETAKAALLKPNAAILYWKDIAELALAVHEDDEKRVAKLRLSLHALLAQFLLTEDPEGHDPEMNRAVIDARTALAETV